MMKILHCSIVLISYAFLPRVSISATDVTSKVNEHVKIVGGQTATKNEFPWIVNLQTNTGEFCGGAIINESWVLTAGHCVKGISSITVRAGDHDLEVTESGEQTRESRTFLHHRGYIEPSFQNDIALIKLPTPFAITQTVAPLTLPPMSFNATGTVTVAGWGVQNESGNKISRILRKVDLNITSYETCSTAYGTGNISKDMICASAPGKDSCQGDSGGPLLCPVTVNSTQKYLFCGIVSFGVGCARPKYPGVYTNVGSYLQWIQDTQDTVNIWGNDQDKIICSAVITIASVIISVFVR